MVKDQRRLRQDLYRVTAAQERQNQAIARRDQLSQNRELT
jgi:hypothetical protein